MKRSCLLLAGLFVVALLAAAPALAEDSVEQQTMEIARQLRCPVCQNLSAADSPSQLAGQMRDIIRQKVQAGESRDQILAYFVGIYGDGILESPPPSGFSGLAWLGAAAIPLAGIAIGGIYIRRRLGVGIPGQAGAPEVEEPW